jgi:hypothetical protein
MQGSTGDDTYYFTRENGRSNSDTITDAGGNNTLVVSGTNGRAAMSMNDVTLTQGDGVWTLTLNRGGDSISFNPWSVQEIDFRASAEGSNSQSWVWDGDEYILSGNV